MPDVEVGDDKGNDGEEKVNGVSHGGKLVEGPDLGGPGDVHPPEHQW